MALLVCNFTSLLQTSWGWTVGGGNTVGRNVGRFKISSGGISLATLTKNSFRDSTRSASDSRWPSRSIVNWSWFFCRPDIVSMICHHWRTSPFFKFLNFLRIKVIFLDFDLQLNHPSILAPQMRVTSMERALALFNKLLYVSSNPWFVCRVKSNCFYRKEIIYGSVKVVSKG